MNENTDENWIDFIRYGKTLYALSDLKRIEIKDDQTYQLFFSDNKNITILFEEWNHLLDNFDFNICPVNRPEPNISIGS